MRTLPVVLALLAVGAQGATYYVSNAGDDRADGLSPETAWLSLSRVAAAELEPGDSVLFRRGDMWRGQLVPRSGAEGAYVLYGAWGEGPKPQLRGSAAKDLDTDWRDEGDGLWSTGDPPAPPLVVPAEWEAFEARQLWIHNEGGAASNLVPQGAGYRLDTTAAGGAGNHQQLIARDLPVVAGGTYRLVARVRSSTDLLLPGARLMQTGSPWTGYSSLPEPAVRLAAGEWTLVVQYYQSHTTDTNARLTWSLGGLVPAGNRLDFERVTFEPCDPADVPGVATDLSIDVGNIIFDGGPRCGVKRWKVEDLVDEGDYWYDRENQRVWLRCAVNPTARWQSLEPALRRHIIDQSGRSWVIYENLDLRYGAAHGIGGGSVHHTISRDLDISYIGGGDQTGPPRHVRFGNGIEYWGEASDHLVERCRIWEVYDAALTNQSNGDATPQTDIIYRNNIIWNCEYSFEYWNRPETSHTDNVQFIHNTCYNAGYGWGHGQRPDPGGRHLCFYAGPAPVSNFLVANNVFVGCTNNALYAPQLAPEILKSMRIERNLWWQPEGNLIWALEKYYTQDQFDAYQAEVGNAPGNLVAEARLVDQAALDFRLAADSPAVDAGLELGVTEDFGQAARPAGAGPDIGSWEVR